MNTDPEFHVVPRNHAFEIVDSKEETYGSYPEEDRAEFYRDLLNEKWQAEEKVAEKETVRND